MGLFDGYGYGDSDQGGLIDRLMAQLGVQNQYQPGQGFGASPMNANAAMPAQQNAPIAVGDYQMPRIGSGWHGYPEHDPQTGATMAPQAIAQQPAPSAPTQPMQMLGGNSGMPSALQPYQSPGGFGGAFRGMASNAQAGPLGMIMGGIGGAMGMGQGTEQDQARQTAAQTFKQLVPILGEQKATLAVLNPTMGQEMVKQALAGKQYGFQMLPDGTMVRTDAHAGTVAPVYSGAAKPTFGVINEEDGKKTYGWMDPSKRSVTPYQPAGADDIDKGVTGPDGKLIPYPPGADRKTFRNEISKINADAAGGKMTEVQAKSTKFGNQMELAEKNIKGLDDQYTGLAGNALRVTEGSDYLPGSAMAGRLLQTNGYQKFVQARNSFLTALLRDESGAAIGSSEFVRREKEMFPQPNDGSEVVKQKRELRRIAIEGMKKAAGPGYKGPTDSAADGETKADPLGIR